VNVILWRRIVIITIFAEVGKTRLFSSIRISSAASAYVATNQLTVIVGSLRSDIHCIGKL